MANGIRPKTGQLRHTRAANFTPNENED